MDARTPHSPHPLDALLDEVIHDEGGTCTAAEARADLVASMEQIQADMAARGESEAPFAFYNVSSDVAVVVIAGGTLDLYVMACPKKGEWELTNRFDRLVRTDVENWRARLRDRYGKEQPDLLIPPELAAEWLYPDEAKTSEEETVEGTVERTRAARGTRDYTPGPTEPTEPAESNPPTGGPVQNEEAEPALQGDPYLEQMMDAVRAAGGGKGRRPWRPTDFG